MTLGIQPTFPNTGFGYIEFDKTDDNPIKKVSQFREKPDYETAKSFLEQGNFLWNGGIFIWSAKSIAEAPSGRSITSPFGVNTKTLLSKKSVFR